MRPEQGDRALVMNDPVHEGCDYSKGDVLLTGAVGTLLPSSSELWQL